MNRLVVVVALLIALPVAASAEPKTIAVEGCAKVVTKADQQYGRKTMTVECTGEAFDPKVKEDKSGALTWDSGGSWSIPADVWLRQRKGIGIEPSETCVADTPCGRTR